MRASQPSAVNLDERIVAVLVIAIARIRIIAGLLHQLRAHGIAMDVIQFLPQEALDVDVRFPEIVLLHFVNRTAGFIARLPERRQPI